MNKKLDENRRRAEGITAEAARVFYVGLYAKALTLFDEAIALDNEVVRAYTGKSLTLAQLGRPAEGLASAEKAVGLEPTNATAYTALALCLHRLGRTAEAEAAYARAFEIDPEHPRVLYNYACFRSELGDEDACREYITRAFRHVDAEAITNSRFDPDLARYINTDWFRELLAQAKKRQAGNED
ncbi:MAG: tetratricopeptide repeat protein [Candidatus Zixiibacteriota bacterium]|jgi:Flp pilus assembly protein TadD